MLIVCPECELKVSDKAFACPHCGYPMKEDNIVQKKRKSNRRKRLPNGFGQISEIKNANLRKPFRAMVTVGKTEEGKPISKLLKPESYFATYNEAYEALIEYNRNPYDFDDTCTVADIFDKWFEQYSNMGKSESIQDLVKCAWRYCYPVYDLKISDVKRKHIRYCMEDATLMVRGKKKTASKNMQIKIRYIFKSLFDYALERDMVKENIANDVKIISGESDAIKSHKTFSEKELKTLWDKCEDINENAITIKWILIQCYSGWRPSELLNMKVSDVDLNEKYFKGGMKTKAGKERIVPIHYKIEKLVTELYNDAVSSGRELLFPYDSKKRNIRNFRYHYRKAMEWVDLIGVEHKPHDGRKTFVTKAKKNKVDEYAIKYMVGHTIEDLTERVYTVRELGWLKDEMKKIK